MGCKSRNWHLLKSDRLTNIFEDDSSSTMSSSTISSTGSLVDHHGNTTPTKHMTSQPELVTSSHEGSHDNLYTHLLYPLCNSYYNSLASTRSISVGDVRITRSSPTPSNSTVISSPHGSEAASIGDLSVCSAPTPNHSGAPSPTLSTVTSPEIRRKNWRQVVHRVREDLEGVCHLIRKGSAHEKETDKMGSNKDLREVVDVLKKRTITVEYEEDRLASHLKHSRHSRWNRFKRHHLYLNDDLDTSPNQHIETPCLVLRAIANCLFHAEVHLKSLPYGNLILRIMNNRIYILVNKATNNNVCRAELYGKIDLPIYVKPRTLQFQFCDEYSVLSILGSTKNYGISVSSSDICQTSSAENSPCVKRKGQLDTILSIDKNFGSMDNIPSSMFEKDALITARNKAKDKKDAAKQKGHGRESPRALNDVMSDDEAPDFKQLQFRRRSFTK